MLYMYVLSDPGFNVLRCPTYKSNYMPAGSIICRSGWGPATLPALIQEIRPVILVKFVPVQNSEGASGAVRPPHPAHWYFRPRVPLAVYLTNSRLDRATEFTGDARASNLRACSPASSK